MPRYRLYDLIIDSELALPEAPELPDDADAAPADVRIHWAEVPANGIDAPPQGPFCQIGSEVFWLDVPGIARYQVSHGRDIAIEGSPGRDAKSIRVFLLGSVFAALLLQRGCLVLHGNAIAINGQSLVCVGHSGSGKSTLAAAFQKRGYPVLADDVVALDAHSRVMPGLARIKLWHDAARKMDIDLQGLQRLRPGLEKFSYPVPQAADLTPLPVRWLYVLSADEETFSLTPFTGMARFNPLRSNTYRLRFMEAMALRNDHLKQVARLAGRVHMAQIGRPRSGFRVQELVDFILADIAEHPE